VLRHAQRDPLVGGWTGAGTGEPGLLRAELNHAQNTRDSRPKAPNNAIVTFVDADVERPR